MTCTAVTSNDVHGHIILILYTVTIPICVQSTAFYWYERIERYTQDIAS